MREAFVVVVTAVPILSVPAGWIEEEDCTVDCDCDCDEEDDAVLSIDSKFATVDSVSLTGETFRRVGQVLE